jgi:VWFA-related protein
MESGLDGLAQGLNEIESGGAQMQSRRLTSILVVLHSLASASLFAQDPPAAIEPFTGQIQVTEALVDVLVTDRDGNLILGLKPADFRVAEAGRELTVKSATFYSNRRFLDAAGAARLGIDPAAVPDRRLMLLLFDDQRRLDTSDPTLLLSRQMKAGRDVAAWLRGGLEPGDLVAILSFDSRLRLQQEFTADRALLERAVDRAIRGAEEPKDWPSRAEEADDFPSLSAALPKGDALLRATPRLEDALTTLADAAAPIAGRKNLLLFTSGFGELSPAGAPQGTWLDPMIQALNAANVAVYSIDMLPPGAEHPWSATISVLASETGGRPFFDQVDFRLPVERVAATTNGYYLVAFESPHPADETGYRAIEVTVANPEFRVTARKGYRLD